MSCYDLFLSIYSQCIMSHIVIAEHIPAGRFLRHIPQVNTFRFQRMIILCPEIHCPPDAIRLNHKRAYIHMSMAFFRGSSLHTQVNSVIRFPGSPHNSKSTFTLSRIHPFDRSRDVFKREILTPYKQHGEITVFSQTGIFSDFKRFQLIQFSPDKRRGIRLSGKPIHNRIHDCGTPVIGKVKTL